MPTRCLPRQILGNPTAARWLAAQSRRPHRAARKFYKNASYEHYDVDNGSSPDSEFGVRVEGGIPVLALAHDHEGEDCGDSGVTRS